MNEPVLNNWIDPGLLQAISWTLIHSLWLGAGTAVLAATVMLFTRRSRPALRYRLFTLLLFAFAAAVAVLFLHQWGGTETERTRVSATAVLTASHAAATVSPQAFSETSLQPVIDYCNRQSGWIVVVWMLIFLYQMARLVAGLHYIHRIRTVKTVAVPEAWQHRAIVLSRAMGIRQKIDFLQSTLVRVPVVVGYFKPVVLLPLGLITQLDPRYLEPILLHELAHIRRKDFAVNLLQSFLESIFFFNPGLLWLSSVIREEREACCDDMVLGYTSDKKNYFEALLCFQEQKASFAMALQTRKGYLLHRVKRMLTNENKKLNIMERIILVSGLMLFSAFAFLPAAQTTPKNTAPPVPVPEQVQPAAPSVPMPPARPARSSKVRATLPVKDIVPAVDKALPAPPPQPPVPDTLPEKSKISHLSTNINDDGTTKTSEMTVVTKDGKKYYIRQVNGVTELMTVDGKNIPKEEMGQHNDVLREIEQRQRLAKQKREQSELQRAQRAAQRRQDLAAQQSIREKKRLEQNKASQLERKAQQERLQKKQLLGRENVQRRKEELQRAHRAERPKNEVSSIIQDLAREQVITSTDELSFTLTENELVVNGTRQDPALQQRLKERYNLKNGDRIDYRKSGGSTSTSIHRN
jgi:bla regulator protein blaR1